MPNKNDSNILIKSDGNQKTVEQHLLLVKGRRKSKHPFICQVW